jgi:hypothetical protein
MKICRFKDFPLLPNTSEFTYELFIGCVLSISVLGNLDLTGNLNWDLTGNLNCLQASRPTCSPRGVSLLSLSVSQNIPTKTLKKE